VLRFYGLFGASSVSPPKDHSVSLLQTDLASRAPVS